MIEEGMLGGWRTDGLGPFVLETAGTDRQVVGQAGLMIFDTRDWTPSTWARQEFTLSPSSAGPWRGHTGDTDTRLRRPQPFATGRMSAQTSIGLSL